MHKLIVCAAALCAAACFAESAKSAYVGLLKPGQGLEEIPLNQTLAKGTYPAMVFYQCVLLDEEQTPINAAESTFTLIVN